MGNIQAISSDMISKDLTSSGTGLEKPHTWTRYWKLTREKFCFIMVLITIRAPCQRNGYANELWRRKNGGKRFCRGYYSVLHLYQNCDYFLSNQTTCTRGSTNFYTHERRSGHHDWPSRAGSRYSRMPADYRICIYLGIRWRPRGDSNLSPSWKYVRKCQFVQPLQTVSEGAGELYSHFGLLRKINRERTEFRRDA